MIIRAILLILLGFSMSSIASTIPLEKLIGKLDEKQDATFVALDSTQLPVNKKGMYLQKEPTKQLVKAYQAFKKAHPDIPFVIVSAMRNYQYQNGIWQRKWNALFPKLNHAQKTAENILQYSSMPGTSRHHWGTDVDITSLSSEYFQHDKKGKILYQWLQENMPKYGFCQPYTEGRKGGYLPEEWHWSYKPIAKQYLTHYQDLLNHNEQAIIQQLTFAGHDNIKLVDLVNEYVLTINSECVAE